MNLIILLIFILYLILFTIFSREVIAIQGPSKIHNDEIVLTGGYCPNVIAFLLRAAKHRNFQVLVTEGAPSFQVRYPGFAV